MLQVQATAEQLNTIKKSLAVAENCLGTIFPNCFIAAECFVQIPHFGPKVSKTGHFVGVRKSGANGDGKWARSCTLGKGSVWGEKDTETETET